MANKQTKPRCFIRSEFGYNVEISNETFEGIIEFLKSESVNFRLVLSSHGIILCK